MSELLLALAAICSVESSGNPSAVNVNDGGSPSLGLCQIKFETAKLVGFRGGPSELLKRHVNHHYAYRYLRKQYHRYGCMKKAIAAYNAGSVRGEIRNLGYVTKVLNRMEKR